MKKIKVAVVVVLMMIVVMISCSKKEEASPTELVTTATPVGVGGGKIAFYSDRDGNWEIYVMDANGSNQTRLTNNSAEDGVERGGWK
jgi:TolB protein